VQKIKQKEGKEKAQKNRDRSTNSRRPPELVDIENFRVLINIWTFKVQISAESRSANAIFENAAELTTD